MESVIFVVFSKNLGIPFGKRKLQGKAGMQQHGKVRNAVRTTFHVINAWAVLLRQEAQQRFGRPVVEEAVKTAARDREEFAVLLSRTHRRNLVPLYSRLGEEARRQESGLERDNIMWAQSQARERLWLTDS
jgi:hypothetical protein